MIGVNRPLLRSSPLAGALVLLLGCQAQPQAISLPEPVKPPYLAELLPIPAMPAEREPLLALARASAADLAREADAAAPEPDMPAASRHGYPAGVLGGAVSKALISLSRIPDLPPATVGPIRRARDHANLIVVAQTGLNVNGGGGPLAGGATYQESWGTVARLARQVLVDLEAVTF